ncbi:NaeI family type II restriction endonuclease [Paludibacterium yongneupense]|uniref:NaeI family type II restriction endonuclease n=1 Tax=Paludibacterium yongneupense TaxID=400061 RepID=UPI000685B232|nr:NaeI family type II restriction endonuclease [Paludibacterium yongneupense]
MLLPTLDNRAQPSDPALIEVANYIVAKPNLDEIIGQYIRQAFDEVIDGPRTGRYAISQLEKTEKTYIGTKIEIILRAELGLGRGKKLDNFICGHEVDTKFSLSGQWMIPTEASDELCLLVSGDEVKKTCSFGLLRATADMLTVGANQDKKRTVSSMGKENAIWFLRNSPMPKNFVLELPNETRQTILSQRTGKARLHSLFRNVTGQIIPRSAILQIARSEDPLKRAREAKGILEKDGLLILCATYAKDRELFVRHGFTKFNNNDWLCIDKN